MAESAEEGTEIAVISDSHVPDRADQIPEKFWDKIESADIVVHAGDFAREETFNALEHYSTEFHGVKGNCDFFEVDEMEESKTFEAEGLKFGVYHGTGITPRGHKPTLEKIAEEDLECDILIHGHSHQKDIYLGDSLLLNPGSCTGVGGGSARPSDPKMMEISIKDEKVEVAVIEKQEEELIREESRSFNREEIKEA
jgi:putative phosphoesterase